MWFVGVALLTGYTPFMRGNGQARTGNAVICSRVAILTTHVVASHVDVVLRRWLNHRRIKIAVLYTISAAAIEMASPTASSRRAAYVVGNLDQIYLGVRQASTGRRLLVLAGCVMADQTVNIPCVSEVERFIFPAITYVTTGAAWPVGDHVNAVIVDNPDFAQRDLVLGAERVR